MRFTKTLYLTEGEAKVLTRLSYLIDYNEGENLDLYHLLRLLREDNSYDEENDMYIVIEK